MNSPIKKSELIAFQNDLCDASYSINKMKLYFEYAISKLNEYLQFDSVVLNTCGYENKNTLKYIDCFRFKQPEKIGLNYEKFRFLDAFTPAVLSQPRILNISNKLVSYEQLSCTDFYKLHCSHFDMNTAMAVSARIPNYKRTYLVLYLISADPYRFYTSNEIQFINTIVPALFSTLFKQLGCICEETMSEQIDLLNRFCGAPKIMELIQLIVDMPERSRKEYAKILKKSPNTLNTQFQTIFEKLEIKNNKELSGDWNLKLQVFEKYYFLRK